MNPCNDDIWNVHVRIDDNYKCVNLSSQGDEYIKTFKLNRKSYVDQRRLISDNQKKFREKVEMYKDLCRRIVETGIESDVRSFLLEEMSEYEKFIINGINYRMSENAFEEDIDDLIFSSLSKVGTVKCIDKDYDLFYEVDLGYERFSCYVELDAFTFDSEDMIKRYISTEKINVWKEINEKEKILIIIFNRKDNNVYFAKLDDIIQTSNVYNSKRCAYFLKKENIVSNLR